MDRRKEENTRHNGGLHDYNIEEGLERRSVQGRGSSRDPSILLKDHQNCRG